MDMVMKLSEVFPIYKNKRREWSDRMFFWNVTETIHYSPKASLQACHKRMHPKVCGTILNPKQSKIKVSKRTFSLTAPFFQASMCVEAAFSFSFFLFFFVNIFSMFFFFSSYAKELEKLQQQGKELAVYAYTVGNVMDTGNQNIVLKDSVVVDAIVPILGFSSCKMIGQCIVKPWTGYCLTNIQEWETEKEYVYITNYGEVYHRSRSCHHLSLNIRVAAYNEVREERNENGAKYYPCEYCGSYNFSSVAFLTAQGNRYHSMLNCRGLKRTIQRVPIEECTGKGACKSCG